MTINTYNCIAHLVGNCKRPSNELIQMSPDELCCIQRHCGRRRSAIRTRKKLHWKINKRAIGKNNRPWRNHPSWKYLNVECSEWADTDTSLRGRQRHNSLAEPSDTICNVHQVLMAAVVKIKEKVMSLCYSGDNGEPRWHCSYCC